MTGDDRDAELDRLYARLYVAWQAADRAELDRLSRAIALEEARVAEAEIAAGNLGPHPLRQPAQRSEGYGSVSVARPPSEGGATRDATTIHDERLS